MKHYPDTGIKNPKTYNSRADRLFMEGGIGVMHCHFCKVKSPLKMSWHGRTQCRVCGMVWWIGNTVRPAAIHEVIRRQYVWNFFCRMEADGRIWMGSDLINEHKAVVWKENRGGDWHSSFESHHGIISRSNHDARIVFRHLATDLLLHGLGGTSMEDVPEWAQIYLRDPDGLLTHTRLVRRTQGPRRDFRDVLPFGVTGVPKGFWHYDNDGRWSRSAGTRNRRPTGWHVSKGLGAALRDYVGQLRDLECFLDPGAYLRAQEEALARKDLLIGEIPGFELADGSAEVGPEPIKHEEVGLPVGGDLLGTGNDFDIIDGFELVPTDGSQDVFLSHAKGPGDGGRLDPLGEQSSDGPSSDGCSEATASGS